MKNRLLTTLGLPITLITSLPALDWTGGTGAGTNFNSSGNWTEQNKVPKLPNGNSNSSGESAVFLSSASPFSSANIEASFLVVTGGSTVVNLSTGGSTLSLGTREGGVGNTNNDLIVSSGSTLNFSGTLSGPLGYGGLYLEVDGTARFSGEISNTANLEADTPTDDIFLRGGGSATLVDTTVSGSLTVSSTTLRGSGDVTGGLTLNGGTLSPGENGAGTLDVTGNVSGSGTWIFDAVDSSTRDLVTVGGTLDVSGFTLNLSGTQDISGGPIVIATYGGTATPSPFGTVNGLLSGQSISYTGGQIAITGAAIIPEVTNIIPLSLAFLPLLTLRNRRSGTKVSASPFQTSGS